MKGRMAIAMTLGWLLAAPAGAAPNAALEQALRTVGTQVAPEQVARLRQAISSSPSLEAQMNALAASGQLTQIAIGEESALPSKPGPFAAWLHGSTWAFQTDFIGKHGKTRLMDVVAPGEVLPDNLVFALGHLAYKAQTAKAMEAVSPKTMSKEAWVQARIDNDAAATIQAWNDTVDTAQHANGGQALSGSQAGSLLLNLQYREVFIRAMRAPGQDKLQFGNDGRIAATPANLASVGKALSSSSLFDVQ